MFLFAIDEFSLKSAAFAYKYKPFAVCIAQHFRHALRGPTICSPPEDLIAKKTVLSERNTKRLRFASCSD
jgi:hypothetical protein